MEDARLIRRMVDNFIIRFSEVTNPKQILDLMHSLGREKAWGQLFSERINDPDFCERAEQGLLNAIKQHRKRLKKEGKL